MDKARLLLYSLYLPGLLVAIAQQGMSLLIPLYMIEVGGSIASAATVIGMRGLGMMLVDIPAGLLAARIGDKRAILLSLACICSAMLCLILATGWYTLMLIMVLHGIGSGAWLTARLSYVTDTCERHIRGRVIAMLAATARAGAILGPLTAGIVAGTLGYATAFLGTAALVLAALLLFSLMARHVPPHEADSVPQLDRLLGVVADHRRILLTAGSAAVVIMLLRTSRRLLVPLFGAALGLDAASVGLIFSLSMVLDLSLSYPAGMLMDKRGRKWAAIPCVILLSLSLMLLPLATDFSGLLMVALLAGIGNGLGSGAVQTMGSDLSPPGRRGEFLGVWRLISDIGIAGGPLLIGALTQISSLTIATLSASGLGFLGVFILLVYLEDSHKPGTGDGVD